MSFSNGHALLIAVGTFQNHPKLNVSHTIRDVEGLQAILQNPNRCGYPADQITLLTQEEATKEGIEAAFDQLAAKTSAESTVFVYLASHGNFGADGRWYFKPHDVVVNREKRVESETGISEAQFSAMLANIKAERLIIFMNTCFSGNLVLGDLSDDAEGFPETRPSRDGLNAMLGSGQGRIIITAAGDNQKSYFNRLMPNEMTFFGEAVVNGLKGSSLAANGGVISAFDLYSYVYMSVTDKLETFGDATLQTPEFTVRKAVGPFPIALHRGKLGELGEFDDSAELPSEGEKHQIIVPDEEAKRSFQLLFGKDEAGGPLLGDGPIYIGKEIQHDESERTVNNYGDFNIGQVNAAIVNNGGEQTFNESLTIDVNRSTKRSLEQEGDPDGHSQTPVQARMARFSRLVADPPATANLILLFELVDDILKEIEPLPPGEQTRYLPILSRLEGLLLEALSDSRDQEMIGMTVGSLQRAAAKHPNRDGQWRRLLDQIVIIAQKG